MIMIITITAISTTIATRMMIILMITVTTKMNFELMKKIIIINYSIINAKTLMMIATDIKDLHIDNYY